MKVIWSHFHDQREINRSGAYRELLSDLTQFADQLIPYAIGLKDFVSLCMSIEDYLKGASGESGTTPLDHLKDFLGQHIEPEPALPEDEQSEESVN